MKDNYPTKNGIAVSPHELWLPASTNRERRRNRSNHHTHFPFYDFAGSVVRLTLRDLDRHQFILPDNVHNWIHDTYDPPVLPTEEQAAKEVIDAYEKAEYLKVYDQSMADYIKKEIPLELIDGLIAIHGLQKFFSMAAD